MISSAWMPPHGTTRAAAVGAVQLGATGEDQQLVLDLDWKAQLTLAQEVICWHTAAAVCCVAYALTAPPALSIPYGTCIGLLFGLLLVFMRSSMMEVLYKAKEKFEADLGDPDSRFHVHDNLQVHVKVKAPANTASPEAALHCYHGFGSNTWSWSLVQQQLADRLGALVTAHDMPGFGLTERPSDLSGYYLAFNGRLGRLVLDYELKETGAMSAKEAARAEDDEYPHASLHTAAADTGAAATAAPAPSATAALPAEEDQKLAAAAQPQQRQEQGQQQDAGSKGQKVDQGAPPSDVLVFNTKDLSKSWEEFAGSPLPEPADGIGSANEAAQEAKEQGLEAGSAAEAVAAAAAGDVASAGAALAEAVTAAAKGEERGKAAADATTAPGPGTARRILVGHSLGGACAALEAISHPGDYAALVLVAPAILVGLGAIGSSRHAWLEQLHDDTALSRAHGSLDAAGGGASGGGGGSQEDGGSGSDLDRELKDAAEAAGGLAPRGSVGQSPAPGAPPTGKLGGSGGYTARVPGSEVAYYVSRGTAPAAPRSPGPVGQLLGKVALLMQTTMLSAVVGLILLLRPLVLLGLRAAVRSREFWKSTLQQAYYDKTKVSKECVDAYRLPQLVRGWESGMVRFLLARLGAKGGGGAKGSSYGGAAAGPQGGLEDAGLAQRLAAAVAAHKMPVLVVHGAGDKLVPVSNSLRLARMLPGARVAVLKRSGHCPQEELAEGFTHIVGSFLEGVLQAPRPAGMPA